MYECFMPATTMLIAGFFDRRLCLRINAVVNNCNNGISWMRMHHNSKSTAIVAVLFFCHLNAVGGFVCKPFPILIQGGDAYAVSTFNTHKSFLNAIQKSKIISLFMRSRGVCFGVIREKLGKKAKPHQCNPNF